MLYNIQMKLLVSFLFFCIMLVQHICIQHDHVDTVDKELL